jgi:D-glycero-D-manno-heptose 1,7-bisphosphate phosphatase
MVSRRAVFLDKDGTLIENVPYNVDPTLMRLAPGAEEGLKQLHRAGYLLFVVSNQSGVARGYFPESALQGVADRLRELLAAWGIPLAGFSWCPHHPEGTVEEYAVTCNCRKPAPGQILSIAEGDDIDLARSWMIGDILDDIQAGRAAGCRTILIDNGNESEWIMSPDREPEHRAPDLAAAARYIIEQDDPEGPPA